jgi:hypothetical protein
MNVEEIIKNKTQELIESGQIQSLIEEKIGKSVEKVIDSLFGGYSFQKDIEKKLSEEIDPLLKTIDLSAYKEIVHARAEQIIKSTLDSDLEKKASEQYNLLFCSDKKEIKLSEIIDLIIEEFRENSYDVDRECFTLVHELREERGFYRLNIYFDKENEYEKDTCGYHFELLKYGEDGDYKISKLSMAYKDIVENRLMLFNPGYLNNFERLLLNAYLKKTKIIEDIDLDDVDTFLRYD